MTDIVQRLRQCKNSTVPFGMALEAADEIERIKAATIERCAQVAESTTYMSGAHIAAAIRALKDK